MNEIVFWREIVDSLKERKNNLRIILSKSFKDEYFELYKENVFCNWGKICLSLEKAEKELENLLDKLDSHFKG